MGDAVIDSTMRAGTCLLLSLCASWSMAQEVHVFSGGRPVAVVGSAANEQRGRPPDERRARRPLGERPEAEAIAAAHTAAFLRCGLDESTYPPDKPHAPEEIAYFIKNAGYLPIAGTSKIILVGEYGRGKAIVDLEHQNKILTPQCPAGVRTMFWSPGAGRVAFATQEVAAIRFHGDSRALWTGKFEKIQDIHYVDSAHPEAGFIKLMSLPNEKVLDMILPDKAEHMWVLSQSEKIDLRNPRTWLRALGGNPPKKMDIILRKVDLKGHVIETHRIATSVADGTAHFPRAP